MAAMERNLTAVQTMCVDSFELSTTRYKKALSVNGKKQEGEHVGTTKRKSKGGVCTRANMGNNSRFGFG